MLLVPSMLSTPRGLHAAMNQLFDAPRGEASDAALAPALDVERTDTGYTVTLDMPGVDKADVKVTIKDKRVSVEAQSQTQTASESSQLIYRERSKRRYARSITLPEALDEAASSAKLENGVLTLSLTRLAPSARSIAVN